MRDCFLSLCRGEGKASIHDVPSEPSREEETASSCSPSPSSDGSKKGSTKYRSRKGAVPLETRPSPIVLGAIKHSRCKNGTGSITSTHGTQSDCFESTRCSSVRGPKSSRSKAKSEKSEKRSTVFRRASFLFYAKTGSMEIKRSPSKTSQSSGRSKSTKSAHSRTPSAIPQIPLNQIDAATRGFSSALHSSSSCAYFKGELEGSPVVVKDFSEDGLRKSCFLEEACILGRVRHQNLACVRGVCLEGERRMLVYEDAGLATLSALLHTPDDFKHLDISMDWTSRLAIALDVAKGLNQLHCGSSVPVVHGNIASSSIFVKENGKPLLSDYSIGHTHHSRRTSSSEQCPIVADPSSGYEAPELGGGRRRTVMSDVFAFGVLFLEIMCGCPPVSFNIQEGLVAGVKASMSKGALAEVMDPSLRCEFSLRQVALSIQLALSCTAECPLDRPSIDMIVDKLKEIITLEEDDGEDSDAWGCIAIQNDQ